MALSRRDLVGGAALAILSVRRVFAADDPLARLAAGDVALIMRHARAPGTSDPAGFRLGDCATQRNLDETGRRQARRLGDRLRAAGVTSARVYSSRWCRCLDTADLLGLGPVQPLDALNSFFERPGERDASTDALGGFLAGLDPGGRPPVILVTHQVNITALTGIVPSQGEGLLLRLDGTGWPAVLARVPVED